MRGFVLILVVELHFPDAGSLKGKRHELASVKTHLRGKLGAAVSEIDHHDLWQRATLAVALTGSSVAQLEATGDGIVRWLDARFPQGVRIERTLSSLEDLTG